MPTCTYCGREAQITKDHIIPRSLGLNFGQDNIVDACRTCNIIKGKMSPAVMRAQADEMERGVAALLAMSEPLASVGVEERRKPKPGKPVPPPAFYGPPERENYPSRQAWRKACRQYQRTRP